MSRDADDSPEMSGISDFWHRYHTLAGEKDKDMSKSLNENLDVLLIFAALFSTINTAFITITTTSLSQNPLDQTNALLQLIALRVDNRTITPNELAPPFSASAVSVTSNCLLYASLCCSLMAAMGAMLGKEWLQRFDRQEKHGTTEQQSQLRQLKFNEIQRWHLVQVLLFLPTLILTSVFLLFVGITLYLFSQNRAVATVVVALIGPGFFCIGLITVVAAIYPLCPYQTVVSRGLRRILKLMRRLITSYSVDAQEKRSSSLQPINELMNPSTRLILRKTSDKRLDALKHALGLDQAGVEKYLIDQAMQIQTIRWFLQTSTSREDLLVVARHICSLDVETSKHIASDPVAWACLITSTKSAIQEWVEHPGITNQHLAESLGAALGHVKLQLDLQFDKQREINEILSMSAFRDGRGLQLDVLEPIVWFHRTVTRKPYDEHAESNPVVREIRLRGDVLWGLKAHNSNEIRLDAKLLWRELAALLRIPYDEAALSLFALHILRLIGQDNMLNEERERWETLAMLSKKHLHATFLEISTDMLLAMDNRVAPPEATPNPLPKDQQNQEVHKEDAGPERGEEKKPKLGWRGEGHALEVCMVFTHQIKKCITEQSLRQARTFEAKNSQTKDEAHPGVTAQPSNDQASPNIAEKSPKQDQARPTIEEQSANKEKRPPILKLMDWVGRVLKNVEHKHSRDTSTYARFLKEIVSLSLRLEMWERDIERARWKALDNLACHATDNHEISKEMESFLVETLAWLIARSSTIDILEKLTTLRSFISSHLETLFERLQSPGTNMERWPEWFCTGKTSEVWKEELGKVVVRSITKTEPVQGPTAVLEFVALTCRRSIPWTTHMARNGLVSALDTVIQRIEIYNWSPVHRLVAEALDRLWVNLNVMKTPDLLADGLSEASFKRIFAFVVAYDDFWTSSGYTRTNAIAGLRTFYEELSGSQPLGKASTAQAEHHSQGRLDQEGSSPNSPSPVAPAVTPVEPPEEPIQEDESTRIQPSDAPNQSLSSELSASPIRLQMSDDQGA